MEEDLSQIRYLRFISGIRDLSNLTKKKKIIMSGSERLIAINHITNCN